MREICSFCGTEGTKRRLIEGASVRVCDDCVHRMREEMARRTRGESVAPEDNVTKRWCSFCGKERQEVQCLVWKGYYSLCDECGELCEDILSGRRPG